MDTPEWEISYHVAMLPRLQAEETRDLLNMIIAVAGRHADDADYKRFVKGLDAAADPDAAKPRAPRAGSVDAIARFSGMRVTRVPKVAPGITRAKPGERPGLKAREEVRDG